MLQERALQDTAGIACLEYFSGRFPQTATLVAFKGTSTRAVSRDTTVLASRSGQPKPEAREPSHDPRPTGRKSCPLAAPLPLRSRALRASLRERGDARRYRLE